jgi:hypothetical protein
LVNVGTAGDVEAGAVETHDPIGLVDGRKPFNRLDRLRRLRAVIVFDQFDLARAVFQLEAAGLVDLMRPQPPRREMSRSSAGSERAGLGADHAYFDGALIRARDSDERGCERSRASIFQQIASSHGYLPVFC